MRPYYEDHCIKIYCGDCLEIMPSLEAQTIDLLVTSPPYGVGIEYGKIEDSLENALKIIRGIIDNAQRILSDGGRIAINLPGGVGRKPYFPIGYETMHLFQNS